MSDRHRAVVRPDLVAVRVIAVVMRIEGEPDWLVRLRLDLWNDLLGTGWKVGVEHQHIILQDHPTAVAVALSTQVAFVEVHARCKLFDGIDLTGETPLTQEAYDNTGGQQIH
jgi:hypothetical protein